MTFSSQLTEACKDCSKKIPKSDLPLHKELLCTAQHPLSENKQAVGGQLVVITSLPYPLCDCRLK